MHRHVAALEKGVLRYGLAERAIPEAQAHIFSIGRSACSLRTTVSRDARLESQCGYADGLK